MEVGGGLRDWVKKGLSRVRKLKAFSLGYGGVVFKALVLKAYKELESVPTLGPRLLNNLKVSWLKSERKGFDKIEKSRWCCGARSLQGEDRFPAGPRALLRWFQSGRNRLGRMKKVWLFTNWRGGVMVKAVVHQAQGGED